MVEGVTLQLLPDCTESGIHVQATDHPGIALGNLGAASTTRSLRVFA